jgi:hypothetical protein
MGERRLGDLARESLRPLAPLLLPQARFWKFPGVDIADRWLRLKVNDGKPNGDVTMPVD